MDKHALEILEFRNITETLKLYCLADETRALVDIQEIISNREDIEFFFTLGTALKKVMESGENLPVTEFYPLEDICSRIALEGIVAEAVEIFNLAKFLDSAKKLKSFFKKHSDDQVLNNELEKIPELDSVIKAVLAKISTEGIKDDLPELKAIRSDISRINSRIRKICNGYYSNSGLSSYWQDKTPSQRDGRTVLALKANFKGKIKGIVHEVSNTGSTVFIEPLDVVEANNDLVEKQNEYKYIVYQILKELSFLIRENLEDIKSCIDNLCFIDSVLARAKYSIANKCSRPSITEKGLNLVNARHPILGKAAVPINISLESKFNLLVVSGPNTGGKTVCLKTAGLFALMHQFGMEIPADEGSSISLFDNVFADIGDEQSISNSLSTFSGHMARISEILENSTGSSLVLLDELGSGTDPQDGSALAMAILDSLIEKEATIITTTHNSLIKNFALMNPKVENASVDFDKKTFTPKYRIVQGVPGESHGLEIAQKNGIPESVIKKAFNYSNKNEDISIIIERLNKKERELAFTEKKINEKDEALNEKIREVDLFNLRIKQKELELKKSGFTELNKYLSESRKTIENLVSEIKVNKAEKEKILEVRNKIKEAESRAEELETEIDINEMEVSKPAEFEIRENMHVLVGNFKRPGITVRKEKNGKWLVVVNSVKMMVKENEIFNDPSALKEKTAVEYTKSSIMIDNKPEYELNLLGKRLNEALEIVDKQIDRAILSGMREFVIVHGKGNGILQEGIHALLRDNRNIADYHFASQEFGGFGKTIVILNI